MGKSFFDTRFWNGNIDHGNHCNSHRCFSLSKLCLVHYHCRNLEQHKKKVINNVKGLGYDCNDLNKLKTFGIMSGGGHHILHMVNIHEGKYYINTNDRVNENDIDLSPISNFVKHLKYK